MQYGNLANVLENISDAYFALDNNWRFTYVNAKAQQLLRKTWDELIGHHICDVLEEVGESSFISRYQEAMATGQIVEFEGYAKPYNAWARVKAVPCSEGLMVFFDDITAKKYLHRLNETLNAIRKLSVEMADIDGFLQAMIVQLAQGMNCSAGVGCTCQSNDWRIKYIYNLPAVHIGSNVPEKALAHLMEAIFRQKPVVFTDENIPLKRPADISAGHPCTILAMPLFVRDNPLGGIFLYQAGRDFNESQLDFAKRAMEFIKPLLTNVVLEFQDKKHLATFKAILEQVPIGIALLDTRLRFTQVNTWLANKFNTTAEETIGCNFREVITDRLGLVQAEQLKAIYRHTLETGEAYVASAWSPPVAEVYFDWMLNRIEVDGVAVGLLLTTIDVSKHVQMQKELEIYRQQLERLVEKRTAELRRANERFYTAFNASPGFMIIHNVQGRIIDVNSSFINLTGWSKNEVMGSSVCELNLFSREVGQDIRRRFWRDGHIKNQEIAFITKDGQTRTGLLSAEKIMLDGKIHMLTLVTDVTELKLMEREMVRLDRLNLVGQMAAGISHEVRNPMTTVRGFLQMLLRKEECNKYYEYFELMISELDRANSIISEFLSVTKTKQSSCVETDLNDIIKTLEPLLTTDAVVKGKGIRLDLGDIPRLWLNEKEIRQLLLNLVRNGLEAMPQAGAVTIRTYEENGQVVLAVQDQGTGILPHILSRLGTPFLTSKVNGTGLGLAVCYSIAERHDAKIEVSTASTGTTFCVKFNQLRECV